MFKLFYDYILFFIKCKKCNYYEHTVFFHTHTPFALGIDMCLRPSLLFMVHGVVTLFSVGVKKHTV